jgi:hypothetical protein
MDPDSNQTSRKKHGGSRRGAGRKPLAKRDKINSQKERKKRNKERHQYKRIPQTTNPPPCPGDDYIPTDDPEENNYSEHSLYEDAVPLTNINDSHISINIPTDDAEELQQNPRLPSPELATDSREESSNSNSNIIDHTVFEGILQELLGNGNCNCQQNQLEEGLTLSEFADYIKEQTPGDLLRESFDWYPDAAATGVNFQKLLFLKRTVTEDSIIQSYIPLSLPKSQPPEGQIQQIQIRRSYDIDSSVFVINSLAACCGAIQIIYQPGYLQTLRAPLNFFVKYDKLGKDIESDKLHKVRNILIATPSEMSGSLGGFNIHIFFPNLPYNNWKMEQYLTNNEQQQWYDCIFFPALREVASKNTLQRQPGCWKDANSKGKMRKEAHNGTMTHKVKHLRRV